MTTRIIAGAITGLILSTGAFAQSYTAPAGIPTTTAPGGLDEPAANIAGYGSRYGRSVGRGKVIDEDLYTGSAPRRARTAR